MDFSKLTEGLGDDLKNLGENVISGKESFSDAMNEEKDSMFGKVKGMFGGDDDAKTDDSKDDDTEEK